MTSSDTVTGAEKFKLKFTIPSEGLELLGSIISADTLEVTLQKRINCQNVIEANEKTYIVAPILAVQTP